MTLKWLWLSSRRRFLLRILIAAQTGPFRHELYALFIIESRLLLIQIILPFNIVAKFTHLLVISWLVNLLKRSMKNISNETIFQILCLHDQKEHSSLRLVFQFNLKFHSSKAVRNERLLIPLVVAHFNLLRHCIYNMFYTLSMVTKSNK